MLEVAGIYSAARATALRARLQDLGQGGDGVGHWLQRWVAAAAVLLAYPFSPAQERLAGSKLPPPDQLLEECLAALRGVRRGLQALVALAAETPGGAAAAAEPQRALLSEQLTVALALASRSAARLVRDSLP